MTVLDLRSCFRWLRILEEHDAVSISKLPSPLIRRTRTISRALLTAIQNLLPEQSDLYPDEVCTWPAFEHDIIISPSARLQSQTGWSDTKTSIEHGSKVGQEFAQMDSGNCGALGFRISKALELNTAQIDSYRSGSALGLLMHNVLHEYLDGVAMHQTVLFGGAISSSFIIIALTRPTITFKSMKSLPIFLILHRLCFASNSFTVIWESSFRLSFPPSSQLLPSGYATAY
ncbi:hypothetical protein BDR04DRAFT_1232198 [Suillus decipiens]|nr:hypothetical protein BDR04DRAFT_1232198 [Suillus decipiens]